MRCVKGGDGARLDIRERGGVTISRHAGVLGEVAALGGKAGLRSSWDDTERGRGKASERSGQCVRCRGV